MLLTTGKGGSLLLTTGKGGSLLLTTGKGGSFMLFHVGSFFRVERILGEGSASHSLMRFFVCVCLKKKEKKLKSAREH